LRPSAKSVRTFPACCVSPDPLGELGDQCGQPALVLQEFSVILMRPPRLIRGWDAFKNALKILGHSLGSWKSHSGATFEDFGLAREPRAPGLRVATWRSANKLRSQDQAVPITMMNLQLTVSPDRRAPLTIGRSVFMFNCDVGVAGE
jgi:hypothetical protein